MRLPTPRQWTAIALAAVALPALTYTAWPLVPFLTGLLPEALPVGRLLWGLFFAAVLVAAVVLGRSSIRASPPWLGWLILLAWAVAIAAVTGIVLVVWLILGFPGLEEVPHLSPKDLDAIATRAFAIVAGLGGVALLVISYRRQRTTEADAEREVSKLFTDTFDSASDKLGSEHAAVRLAGVHALARLADEAPEGREDLVQMVIDVLCAYLRMPYTPRPKAPSEHPGRPALPTASSTAAVDLSPLGCSDHDAAHHEAHRAAQEEHRKQVLDFESFQQVRHTIIRIIGDRLRRPTRWRGKNYDFTGVVFDGGDLSGAHFTSGKVDFRQAEFAGGRVDFRYARFTGGKVTFHEASFTGGTVDFRSVSGKRPRHLPPCLWPLAEGDGPEPGAL